MEERTQEIAIEYLEHYKNVSYGMMPEWVWDMAIKALEQEPKWIPVSESLPEEGQRVLCTVMELCDYPDFNEYGVPETFMCEGSYHHSQNITKGWYIYRHPDSGVGGADVIAWMPLPEPYKAESEG